MNNKNNLFDILGNKIVKSLLISELGSNLSKVKSTIISNNPLIIDNLLINITSDIKDKIEGFNNEVDFKLISKLSFIKLINLSNRISSFFTRDNVKVVFTLLKFNCYNKITFNNEEVLIELPYYDKLDLSKLINSEIKIYCTCEDFRIRLLRVLNNNNNLVITDNVINEIKSINDKVVINDKVGLLDKYSYSSLTYLVKNYNTIFK